MSIRELIFVYDLFFFLLQLAAAAGGKSPAAAKKSIKALEKLPNGAFMAAASSGEETCASPRTKRANRRAAQVERHPDVKEHEQWQ